MQTIDPIIIGLSLIVVGGAGYLLLPALLMGVERLRKYGRELDYEEISSEEQSHNRALLIIRSGGILGFANPLARSWLNMEDRDEYQLDWVADQIFPKETFLNLCAAEGSKHLTIRGKATRVFSWRVPTEKESLMIISMEEIDEGDDQPFEDIHQVIRDIDSRWLDSGSLREINDMVVSILSSLVSVENINILLSTNGEGKLCPVIEPVLQPYAGEDPYMDLAIQAYDQRDLLRIDSLEDYTPAFEEEGSYYAFPLTSGKEYLGILELKSTRPKAVSDRQLHLITALTQQIAIMLNTKIEQQRSDEHLRGLALIQQILSISLEGKNEKMLLEEILAMLSGFFRKQVYAGVLLAGPGMNEACENILAGELPEAFQMDKIEFQNLPVREIIHLQTWNDTGFMEYSLLYEAIAASEDVSELYMIPVNNGLSPGEVVIIAGEELFSAEPAQVDSFLRLFSSAVEETYRRYLAGKSLTRINQQLGLVDQIGSLTKNFSDTSTALIQILETIHSQELVDACCILINNESIGSLQIQTTFQVGFPLIASPNIVSNEDPAFKTSVTHSREPYLFTESDAQPDQNVVYRTLSEMVGEVGSLLSIPVLIQGGTQAELVIFSGEMNVFTQENLPIWISIADIISRITSSSRYDPASEDDLVRNFVKLSQVLKFSVELNQCVSEENFWQKVIRQLGELVPELEPKLYNVVGQECIVTEQTKTWNIQYKDLPLIIREALHTQSQILVKDINSSSFQSPYLGIASCVIFPLVVPENSVAAIGLFSTEQDAIREPVMDTIRNYSLQMRAALESIRKKDINLEEINALKARAETLSSILLSTHDNFKDQGIERLLESVAESIRENSPFEVVIIYFLEESTQSFKGLGYTGVLVDKLEDTSELVHEYAQVQPYLSVNFKQNNAYFIPSNARPQVEALVPVSTSLAYATAPSSADAWEVGDTLLIPIRKEEGVSGMIVLDAPRDHKRPDNSVLFRLHQYAREIEAIQENIGIYHPYQPEVQASIQENARRELYSIEEKISTLLHKDLEQTITLQQIYDRAQRVRVGLEIAEHVNLQPDRASVLQILGSQMITQLGFDSVLIAENSPLGPHLITQLGNELQGINPDALLGQKNPLSQTLNASQIIIEEDVDQSSSWKNSPLLNNLNAKGFISFPIVINGEVEVALLAASSYSLINQTEEDKQIYKLIGNQVAIAIQNLKLLTETRRRLREVNLLLDFSQQLGSLDPDEILNILIESTLQVMSHAHAGVVLIFDPKAKILIPQAAKGYTSNKQILTIEYQEGEALPGRVFKTGNPQRIDEVNFAEEYNLNPENLLAYREGTGGRVPVSTMIVPIQASDEVMGVLVVDNFNSIGAFSEEDEALVMSLTKQTALTLENARLFQASNQRAKQLETLTEVAAAISSNLNTATLTSSLLDLLADVIPSDRSILWLRQGDELTIRAIKGEAAGQKAGEKVLVEDHPVLQHIVRSGEVLLIPHTSSDELSAGYTAFDPGSLLAIPLISKGTIVGIIILEDKQEDYFKEEHLQIAAAFSSQAAVAISNARLYEYSVRRAQELVNRSQRLAQLNQISTELSASLDIDHLVKFTVRELIQAVKCDAISAVLFMDDGEVVLAAEQPITDKILPVSILPEGPLNQLRENRVIIQSTLHNPHPAMEQLDFLLKERNPKSILLIPMATSSDVHGFFLFQNDEDVHFRPAEVDLARTICNQASVSIENARFYLQSEQRSMELSTLLETASVASSTLELEQVLETIAEQMVKALSVSAVEIYRWDAENECLLTWIGRHGTDVVFGEVIAEIHLFDEFPLRREMIEKNKLMVLHRNSADVHPSEIKLMDTKGVESKLMLPLVIGDRTLGLVELMELQHREFSPAEIRLAQALTDQAVIAIENARLFDETRSLTEDLERRVQARTRDLENEHQKSRTLLQIGNLLSSSFDLDKVLAESLEKLNATIGCEQSMLILERADMDRLIYKAGTGIDGSPIEGGEPSILKRNGGIAGWVIKEKTPVLINNIKNDSRWEIDNRNNLDYHSAIAAPLLMGEKSLGALILLHREWNFFPKSLLDMLQSSANRFAVAINNSELYQLIRDQAEDLGVMLRTQEIETSQTRAMLEGVAEGVLVTDDLGRITLFNQAAEQILQLKRSEVIGKVLEDFTGLFGTASQSWMETIRTWVNDKTVIPIQEPYSIDLIMEDKRVVEVTLAPVSVSGEFLGTVSIFRDITHRIEVDRLKSEFVATVSHELRTPITPIKGYVDILLMGGAGEVSERQREFLEIVKSNTSRLTRLVDDLLNVSRIEAGESTLNLEEVNLGEVIKELVAEFKQKNENSGKDIGIELSVSRKLPNIEADLSMLRTVMGNILENSYRYTESGGTIKISIKKERDQVLCVVQDSGIGIPKEEQARVFDRFYRGENPMVMATAGTGLGLPIVKDIIEMHGGNIKLESPGIPGEGTKISFSLPIGSREALD